MHKRICYYITSVGKKQYSADYNTLEKDTTNDKALLL